MSKPPFAKAAKRVPELLDLLKERGMTFPDRNRAAHYLRFIGYYRLSGYWFPYQARDRGADHDKFAQPVSFDDILELYVFDRKLRVLVMDALERIEVAVRASISDTMSVAAGPHWFMDAQHFAQSFDHAGLMNRIGYDVGTPNGSKGQSQFVAHYYATYGSPRLPPSWMVFEVVSFGTISRIFEFLEKPHRKAIAEAFELPPQRLISWLHGLTHLRNLCAHHERIWNRVFRVSPSVPKEEKDYVAEPKKFYVQALVIQSLLFRISEETHWGSRLAGLMAEHPSISPAEMGFPLQWRERPLWAASF